MTRTQEKNGILGYAKVFIKTEDKPFISNM